MDCQNGAVGMAVLSTIVGDTTAIATGCGSDTWQYV